jgi:hypothetical protein
MERLSTVISENELTRKSSPNQLSSTKTIPADLHAAVFTVINLSRGTLGWGLKTAADLDEEIRIWALTILDYQIPAEYLVRLWKRARDFRISRLENGKECPDFTAELLAAAWTGPNGLRAELENERIAQGRTLSENAESQCPYCFGSGFRYRFDINGKPEGIVGRCNHEKG